jgi:hypothetical protein
MPFFGDAVTGIRPTRKLKPGIQRYPLGHLLS